MCQLMASPSRSGSVASTTSDARVAAAAMAATAALARGADSQAIAKPASGETDPALAGRSRTWPYVASTVAPGPR